MQTASLPVEIPLSLLEAVGNLLGVSLHSELDAARLVKRGLSTRAYRRLSGRVRFPPGAIGAVSTIRRRLKSGDRFSQEESERLLRVARLYAQAEELFGNEDKAQRWLRVPVHWGKDEPARTPLEMVLDSEPGARLVEDRMLRTLHGIF